MTPLAACLQIAVVLGMARGEESPPVFKSIPTTVKTTEHDTVLLPCYLDNQGGISVKWWKDGVLVADSTSGPAVDGVTNLRLYPNYTLQVSDVTQEDTGSYHCQVVRPQPWGPINQHHAIQVLYPPTLKTSPESGMVEAKLNEEVTLGCTPTGIPKPIITWHFKGEEIKLLNNRNTLRFVVSKTSMAGDYTCRANNGVGDAVTASITLKILYAPEVFTEKLWVHTSPGVRTEIACEIRGCPQPKVDWLFNGEPISRTDHRLLNHRNGFHHILVIRKTRITDFGYYTCRANNSLGSSQLVVQLSGIANPAVFKKGYKQQGDESYTLIWEVDSYSAIVEYSLLFRSWQRQKTEDWSKIIVPAESHTSGPLHTQVFVLTGLNKSAMYEAFVLSRNRFGWSKPSAVYKFSTSGADVELEETTLLETTEVNTVSQFTGTYPADDYSTDPIEAHSWNSCQKQFLNGYIKVVITIFLFTLISSL